VTVTPAMVTLRVSARARVAPSVFKAEEEGGGRSSGADDAVAVVGMEAAGSDVDAIKDVVFAARHDRLRGV
jgi:hypothetical protein